VTYTVCSVEANEPIGIRTARKSKIIIIFTLHLPGLWYRVLHRAGKPLVSFLNLLSFRLGSFIC